MGHALIAPVTSRVRGWPFEAKLPEGDGIKGAVLTDHTRSIDYAARHARFAGKGSAAVLREALAKRAAIVSGEP
jgi:mRNA interferase MazF